MLRVVGEDREPLDRESLRELGNQIAGKARMAAADAVRESSHSEFLEKGKSLTEADIRRWRGRAREAIRAWRQVESLTTELLGELERARAASRTPRPEAGS